MVAEIIVPARVCLYGDHQDYLGLPVIAATINRYIRLESTPADMNIIQIDMPDINKSVSFRLDEEELKGEARYFIAGLRVARRYGWNLRKGYRIRLSGNIPVNAGLSSSSAVMVAWIRFLAEASEGVTNFTTDLLAKMAYEAEVLEFDSPGGLMDQYAISLGGVLAIDPLRASYERLNDPGGILVVGDSGISKETLNMLGEKRKLVTSAIDRVAEADPSFDIKKVKSEAIGEYRSLLKKKEIPLFEAAVRNHSITRQAREILRGEEPDIVSLGRLMYEHHTILRDLVGVSVPEIDNMIEASMKAGACGAKIVGSGGGGCMVALLPEENKEKVIRAIDACNPREVFEAKITGANTGFHESR
ncbi:mevalonate kinase family protein [Robertkochia aurantiaca]|uniref:mevalonate kinase family protein n=1 Tax=Robertkochia aurantiaca TaxID=2873700 RepID=UPI001CCDD291|nr:galactokinase [Robertkochia sp. 3YJGBD-33]